MEKLEREFLENGGEWKKVKLEEIFYIGSSKKIFHANNCIIYDENISGSYPYIVRMTGSNGRKGFLIENKKYLNEGNTISFAQDTFSIFYQKEPYFTGNKVKILKSNLAYFNEKIAQFIIASLNTTLKYYTWGIGSTTESIGRMKLELPFLNGKINFSYMEKFIEELEAERIEELEAYLMATGLKDYKLTKEDQKILDDFEKMSDNSLDKTRQDKTRQDKTRLD